MEAVSKQIIDYLEKTRVECSEESAEMFMEAHQSCISSASMN